MIPKDVETDIAAMTFKRELVILYMHIQRELHGKYNKENRKTYSIVRSVQLWEISISYRNKEFCPDKMKASQPFSGPVYSILFSSHIIIPARTAIRTALFNKEMVQYPVERKMDSNTFTGLRGPGISGETLRESVSEPIQDR